MMIAVATRTLMSSGTGKPPPGRPGGQPNRLQDAVLAVPVLIIEDEAMIAWMMESVLEEMGFTAIAVVATGEDAIAQAKDVRPGLIISDINLGADRLDGVEAVIAIRGDTRVPTVFISAYANEEARKRMDALPGAYLLRKPITLTELRHAVEEAWAAEGRH